MNIHKSRKYKKDTMVEVYPSGAVTYKSPFSDIVDEEDNYICCVISIPCIYDEEEKAFVKGKGEFVNWNGNGFPDIYVNDKRIMITAMRKALRMLEKDPKNKFKYKLIKPINIHRSKLKKGTIIPIYPLGNMYDRAGFCDILNPEWGHVLCVTSIHAIDDQDPKTLRIIKKHEGKELVKWDGEGFPDVYIDCEHVDFKAIKRGIKLLEKDPKNKFKYKLMKKHYLSVIDDKTG